jgi:putative FmdB family regulatory protein
VPIYEYRCTKCGHRFEAIQKVSDAHLSKCEKCKGKAERLISSPAIQFKGSGWYITDYARKGQSDSKGSSEPSDHSGQSNQSGQSSQSSQSSKSSESSSSESSSEKSDSKKKKKDKEKAGSSAK